MGIKSKGLEKVRDALWEVLLRGGRGDDLFADIFTGSKGVKPPVVDTAGFGTPTTRQSLDAAHALRENQREERDQTAQA